MTAQLTTWIKTWIARHRRPLRFGTCAMCGKEQVFDGEDGCPTDYLWHHRVNAQ